MDFVGRQKELNILQRFVESPTAGLLVLYGRRRIGKTRLITHFLDKHPEIEPFYWVATTHNETFQLRSFSQAILSLDPNMAETLTQTFSFQDWETALHYLANLVEKTSRPYLIVLDEFTYLLRNEPAISSLFQKVWDHRLSKIENLKLVLTGSLIGMLAREIFSYQAPLYGRATAQIHLRPLSYSAVCELFSDRRADERVAIYGVTGGVPAYLQLFTRTPDFVSALTLEALVPGSIMLSDPSIILYEQLQEPQTYESILWAIASGFHGWKEIAKMAGLADTALGRYLNILQELELIEKRAPVLAKPNNKSGRYFVKDHFLRFYYRFIVPQLGAIERGYQAAIAEKIERELRAFLGQTVFEELCREWVWAAAMQDKLSFVPEEVGSYWRTLRGKRVQLDVVAAAPRSKRLLIGEAKWGRGEISRHILSDLFSRSERMPQVEAGWQVDYFLFARDGFTPATKTLAAEKNVGLISLEDIEKELALS